MSGFELFVPEVPTKEHEAAVYGGLMQYNAGVAPTEVHPLAVLIRDEDGTDVGGLWGQSYYNWLAINWLFVPETLRGTGVGSQLMLRAEEIARDRGCRGAWLNTFSFQARGFYEKLGFTLFGTIEDHPEGGARYFLKKRFD
ncbi:MAG: GNAT family N-acetyltransferase [Alphaproteobacteria bacterium]|nr:MAG: GNAT family N-acetyltransferase [Alphaproteobacteria bacterium]